AVLNNKKKGLAADVAASPSPAAERFSALAKLRLQLFQLPSQRALPAATERRALRHARARGDVAAAAGMRGVHGARSRAAPRPFPCLRSGSPPVADLRLASGSMSPSVSGWFYAREAE